MGLHFPFAASDPPSPPLRAAIGVADTLPLAWLATTGTAEASVARAMTGGRTNREAGRQRTRPSTRYNTSSGSPNRLAGPGGQGIIVYYSLNPAGCQQKTGQG